MSKKILVIGDVFIDKYIYVKSERKAQENKNINIWNEVKIEERFGGAGNVAINIRELCDYSDKVYLVGSTFGKWFNYNEQRIIIGETIKRPFTKTRYVNVDENKSNPILFRFDDDESITNDEINSIEERVINLVKEHKFDIVVVSDYNKGCITRRIIQELGSIPIRIVDSKRKDLRIFKGFNVLKVNTDEYSSQISMYKEYQFPFQALFDAIVHTKGAASTVLEFYDDNNSKKDKYIIHSEQFEVDSVKSVDVTGCGDTHTSALACSLLYNNDIRKAIKYANKMASLKVQMFGTGVPKGEKK